MNSLIKHPEFGEIRTVTKNGETWFVAQDVCAVLGIDKYRDAVARLDDDERGSVLVDTLGGRQEMTAINESGIYALIMRSRKPEAKKFQKWVTSEVLPSIRKFGYYVNPACMDKKQLRKLKDNLSQMLNRYLTSEDRKKTAKKYGTTEWSISGVINGYNINNAIMQELQHRALTNKEKEISAYAPERMLKVVEKLKS